MFGQTERFGIDIVDFGIFDYVLSQFRATRIREPTVRTILFLHGATKICVLIGCVENSVKITSFSQEN